MQCAAVLVFFIVFYEIKLANWKEKCYSRIVNCLSIYVCGKSGNLQRKMLLFLLALRMYVRV